MTKPNLRTLLTDLADEPGRIDWIVPLVGDARPEVFVDAVSTDLDDIVKLCPINKEMLAEIKDDKYPATGLWEEIVYRYPGELLLLVSTPIKVRVSRSKSCSYSWGSITLTYIRGKTLEDAVAQAVAWAKKEGKPRKARA